MEDHTCQEKKSLTSAGLEPKTSGFDRPLLYRLNYEARREQVVGDNGGNCGNVNTMNVVPGASTKDTNNGSIKHHNMCIVIIWQF